ncbi:conserved protein of unknown function [Georgfuchsia toluolica]|uniref:Photosynthesis system II assembly factor Ycf48/Hcf136-like domain-containing protein n=1 Tax=Georgfuchsia toluolica TaxID=424218 RepID=A0A916N817_9PROT|nr:YCF48-related protein [Georgfuchsia toluolica]CAG4882745.1 conserved protein of unknown function [Georgfuchsia toluolica]
MSRSVNQTFVNCLFALMLMGVGSAWAELDVLQRPALQSARAKTSAMLAVTRAGTRIVAVGERGIVIVSDDNGVNWRQVPVPVSETLTNVRFVNERVGWAIGHSGIILHTTDGGQTWQLQLDGKKAADASLAMARHMLDLTPNDAKAKQQFADAERLVADGPDKPFLDLWFRNEEEGFVVGAYGLILATTDGGKTWRSWQHHLDNSQGHHLYSIDVVGNDIYIAGEAGALFHSTDAGESFSEVKTPYSGSYFGVRHLAGGGVIAFGLRGNIYQSMDGKGGWQKISTNDESALNAATFLDDGSIILVDQGGRVLRSRDGGRSFQAEPVRQGFPLTGAVQAADGAMVLAGLGGVVRSAPVKVESGAKP